MKKALKRALGVLFIPVLLMLPTSGDGPDQALAEGSTHGDAEAVALPQRPLPPDMVEGFGEGRVLAFRYHLSYFCPTTPASDLDGPFGHGDGHHQSEDPKEYQTPTCFFGDNGAGPLVPEGLRFTDPATVGKLYGIHPSFGASLVHSNSSGTDIQTQCSQPGPPFTQVKGPLGTCLMHPMTYRVFPNTGNPPFPDPTPGLQHSHILEGTNHPASWWNVVGIIVTDRSIWPDNDGRCPAGPPRCLTSLAALRDAQAKGLASPGIPSNLYFFFSVAPVANAG